MSSTIITFKAEKGQTVAIIGSTGSGKSTLVNLIPRFYDATKGCVKVDGVDVRNMTQHELRDRLAMYLRRESCSLEPSIPTFVTVSRICQRKM